jgi:hypothetical protein
MARDVATSPFGPADTTVPEPGPLPAPDVAADPPVPVPTPDPAIADPLPEVAFGLWVPGDAEQATIAHDTHEANEKDAPRQRR